MKNLNHQKIYFLPWVLFLFLSPSLISATNMALGQCTLKLGYRTEDKSPFMGKNFDNSGLYSELFAHAANSINCQLLIVRMPKKRIIRELNQGNVDFYPAYNFTKQRSQEVYFIPTGFTKRNVGISKNSLSTVTHLSQLNGHVAVIPFGSINHYKKFDGILVFEIAEMDLSKAIELLLRGRGDFYFANYSEYLYYIKLNPSVKDFLKVHHRCCGEEKKVYLAFSKKSPHIEEWPNPNFDVNQSVSPTNYPTILDSNSIAFQFQSTLQQMKKAGITQKIYNKYFH